MQRPPQLQRQLVFAIGIGLLVMISVGYMFGRSFINPILTLKNATHEVAAGQLDTRVSIQRTDELGELGDSFNTMADRLVELQEDVKRKERQAMFGRMAAGLVHDLSHPIQNIGNSTRLLLRDDVDPESRDTVPQDHRSRAGDAQAVHGGPAHLVKPKPIERFAMDINGSVAEIVDAMRAEGERNGVPIEASYADAHMVIEGDRFALGRVYRNLITNAIQATEPGGRVTITTARVGAQVEVNVTDTGSGIPPERLSAIFDDFVTTKARGLGLGLAISKRIVEQLDGTIVVESEVGRGTSFTLAFPRARRSNRACGGKLIERVRRSPDVGGRNVQDPGEDNPARGGRSNGGGAVFRAADAAWGRRYSAEILVGPGDRIILDDDSVMNLEARARCLVPATLYSRLLAAKATAA